MLRARSTTGGGELAQVHEHARTQCSVHRCEVGEGLHRERLHDAAGVAQECSQYVDDPPALARRPPHPRQHLRHVPAHLLLLDRGKAEKGVPVRLQTLRTDAGDLFHRVRGAGTQHGVPRAQSRQKHAEKRRIGQHFGHDLVRGPDAAPVAPFQPAQNERRRFRPRNVSHTRHAAHSIRAPRAGFDSRQDRAVSSRDPPTGVD